MAETPFKAYIDEAMEIEGNIRTKNPIRIDGKIKGDVLCSSDIIIGEKGIIEGKVLGKELIISGRVKGKVMARERVNLEASARLEADIITPVLSIKEGALFRGSAKVLPRSDVERELKNEWK